MKLNKTISLVLGGVMALSMLAGCSSSSSSGTTTATVTTTTNTSVVSTVQSDMDIDKVGANQYAQLPLTGNETADEADAVKEIQDEIANNGALTTTTVSALSAGDFYADAEETSIIIVEKGAKETDDDLAEAILTAMAARDTTAYCIATMSVFDLTVETTTDLSNYILNGSSVSNYTDTAEYWVIVANNAAKKYNVSGNTVG